MSQTDAQQESILCTPNYEIFNAQNGWTLARFSEEKTGKLFNASGDKLPTDKNLLVSLTGSWKISKKDGSKVFSVSYYEIPKQTSRANIVSYFKALKCRIGYKKANAIYDMFGEKTWDVIDNNPWELINVEGISRKNVEVLIKARVKNNQLRDVIAMCANAHVDIPAYTVLKVINDFGEKTIQTLSANPFALTKYKVPFEKADAIAKSFGLPNNFQPRMEAGIASLFSKATVCGHICIPKTDVSVNGKTEHGIIHQMMQLLNCSENECKTAVNEMFSAGKLKSGAGCIFTEESYSEEEAIAANIERLMFAGHSKIEHLDNIIADYESENFKLADSQIEAVRMVFKSQVSVITGGPGTGKTTVIKAVLFTHQQVFGASSEPILLAPTGKASRRMSEATGYPAATIHSSVGFRGDDIPADEEATINGNLVIIDEASMVDQKICAVLLRKIQTGAKLVFVGDINQLPSVGAGNVLKDIIDSTVIPTTRLNVIFRQKGESPIITNAAKMNEGDTELIYNSTFCFFETETEEETFRKTKEIYLKCIRKYGIENVILLNPQRQNTKVSVGAFNRELQQTLHTPEWEKYLDSCTNEENLSIKIGNTEYKPGDRIMQLKNTEVARNGDIGIIRRIAKYPDPDDPQNWMYNAFIEFNDDGMEIQYDIDMMRDIDLAYATTVHKSQGSEYECVIEVVSSSHPMMLRRQIIYTGITRSRRFVYLVGQSEALKKAIKAGTPDYRFTALKGRLKNCRLGA